MRQFAFILIAGVMLMGAGCPDRTALEKPELAKISQVLREACKGVIDIPSRDLTREEILRLWAVDRYRLGICAKRHTGLAKAIDALEKQYNR